MAASKRPPVPEAKDFVAEDVLWKDFCAKITHAALHKWPTEWNFLVEATEKMNLALKAERPLSPLEESLEQFRMPLSQCVKLQGMKGKLYLPPIPQTRKTDIPPTTSGWHGWKPKINGKSLVTEREGWMPIAARTYQQRSVLKQLGWPEIFD